MHTIIFRWPLAVLLCVSLSLAHATEGSDVISSVNKNVGEDQIPVRIVNLQRPGNVSPGERIDLQAWVAYHYSNDTSMPLHLIIGTIHETVIKGAPALAFKTLERESIVQNLLVDGNKGLTLYQTPHDPVTNPDGTKAFSALQGITMPPAADTSIDAESYIASLQKRSATHNNAY